jgi:hypothetical protein
MLRKTIRNILSASTTGSVIFPRAWMHWVGGLDIVVLSIAAMIQPGLVAKRIDITEDYEGDEVVILTNSEQLADLNERWNPQKVKKE